LSEHLTSTSVADLLEGRLTRRAARAVVAHLFQGCEACAAALVPLPAAEHEYEGAIDSAFATALAWVREGAEAEHWLAFYISSGRRCFSNFPLRQKRRIASWSLCEALLQLSHALRKDYPQEMVHFAEIAVEVASLVHWLPYRLDQLRDLEARAWGELANAYRVADELHQAESALEQAYERCRVGTGDPLLLARLDDIAASLFASQRRFKDAYRSLEKARALFLLAGDHHGAGRTLISLGLFSGYEGHPEKGIQLITAGLNEIDRDRDPDLVYRALTNIVLLTEKQERYGKARELLALLLPLAEVRAGRIDRIKLAALDGRLAVAVGDLEHAAQTFAQAKRAFEQAGLFYHAALAGLELAAVWFRQGRTAEVKGLVGELVTAFSRVQVEREAIAALLMLHKALARDRATFELIQQASAVLERLAGKPGKPGRPERPRS
jgi:tetratricopeptide (TPR) repeat protein